MLYFDTSAVLFLSAHVSLPFCLQTNSLKLHYLLTWLKVLIYIKIHNNIAPTCFGL